MFPRRLLGIFILSAAFVIPAAAQTEKEKAVTDAKAALDRAEKAVKDNKDKAKEKDLQKAVDDAKAALDRAEKAAKEAPAKALLKWKFEKGKDFYQKMSTKTEQKMKVSSNEVTQNQEQTFYFKWSVGENKGDDWTITQKIEGVKMKIDIGSQKIEYDSTNPKDASSPNPLGDFFKALVASEFTLTYNPVKQEVTGIDEKQVKDFIDKLGKQNPQMKPLLEQILSKDALKQMAEPTFAAIPGREVAVGEKWTKKTTLNMGPIGKYENEYTYTYEGKVTEGDNKGLEKIKVETSLKYTPPPEAAGSGTGGLPFKIKSADLKSTSAKGEIFFDPALGRIVRSNMNLTLTGTLNIEIGGQTTDVTLNQEQKSDIENADKSQIEPKK